MRSRVLWRLAAVAAGLSAAGCAPLPERPAGACGNAVVEQGEDCDLFAEGEGAVCGKPESSSACRYVCEGGAACPAGYGCGADGRCRQASGAYKALRAPLQTLHDQIKMGDFDGDGRSELVLLSERTDQGMHIGRILFDPLQQANQGLLLSSRVRQLQVLDADGDGRSDAAFSGPDGVTLLLGDARRELSPFAAPMWLFALGERVQAEPVEADQGRTGDELLGVLFVGRTVELVDLDTGEPLGSFEGGAAPLGPPLVVSGGEAAPCPSLLFAFADMDRLWRWRVCRQQGGAAAGWSREQAAPMALPGGPPAAAPVVLDLDGDGQREVLVWNETALSKAPWDAEGGVFEDVPWPATFGGQLPLATGRINDDSEPDFVFPDRIALSRPQGGHEIAYQHEGTLWSEAVLVDINRDGRLDVVAASHEAFDLEILSRTIDGLFTTKINPSAGLVSGLTVGDFDGDDTPDVAFLSREPDPGGDRSPSSLQILYGSALSSPADPRQIGQFFQTDQLRAGRLSGPLATDGPWDLVLSGRTGSGSLVSALLGSAERTLLSPRALRSGSMRASALSVAWGRFDHPEPDLVVLGRDEGDAGALRLWSLETTAEPTQAGFFFSEPLPQDFVQPDASDVSARGPQVAVGAPRRGAPARVVVAGDDGRGGTAVMAARRDADGFVFGAPRRIDGKMTQESKLRVVDLGGEGQIALLLGSDEEPGELWLVPFSGDEPDERGAVRLGKGAGLKDCACVDDLQGGCRLLVISSDGVQEVIAEAGGPPALRRVEGLPGGSVLAAGDLDGDGVPDVAVGDRERVTLLRAVPVRP